MLLKGFIFLSPFVNTWIKMWRICQVIRFVCNSNLFLKSQVMKTVKTKTKPAVMNNGKKMTFFLQCIQMPELWEGILFCPEQSKWLASSIIYFNLIESQLFTGLNIRGVYDHLSSDSHSVLTFVLKVVLDSLISYSFGVWNL